MWALVKTTYEVQRNKGGKETGGVCQLCSSSNALECATDSWIRSGQKQRVEKLAVCKLSLKL